MPSSNNARTWAARRLRGVAARLEGLDGSPTPPAAPRPREPMSYPEFVRRLKRQHAPDEAMRLAVGGSFSSVGVLEHSVLRDAGFGGSGVLLDVGCGSGRLSEALRDLPELSYIGTDVVGDLLDHAAQVSGRPDWQFHLSDGRPLPVADGTADWVCLFSVLTHLTLEDGYELLDECRRACRPGATIVASYLDFAVPDHWAAFVGGLGDGYAEQPRNQYHSSATMRAWAEHLGLDVVSDRPGGFEVPALAPLVFDDGRAFETVAPFWQSLVVLRTRT